MDMREKQLSREIIFEGKIIKVYKDKVECPNKEISYREVVSHNGGAAILCVTPDDEILLIKQFRYAYNDVIYEIPAGKLEKDENPYDAALRELEEETGNKALELEHLCDIYPTCGYSNEIIYLYLAKNCIKTHTHFDEDEFIETEYVPLNKVKEMILDGTLKDGKAICALQAYLLKYNK